MATPCVDGHHRPTPATAFASGDPPSSSTYDPCMLIGRDAEQAAVSRLVAGARVGHSGTLVLTGEAGIGKTALLRHTAAQAGGMQVLRAAGTESERNVAFGG